MRRVYFISKYFPKALLLFLLIGADINFSYSQSAEFNVEFKFDSSIVELQDGEGVKKLVQVINLDSAAARVFSIDVNYPRDWKLLTNLQRSYTIAANDTMYIPINLIPSGKLIGNSKYFVSAYLIDDSNTPIASSYFIVKKPKKTEWKLTVMPSGKQYLRNNETDKNIGINLINSGTEKETFTLNIQTTRTDMVVLSDTSGSKILKKNNFYFDLESFEDSTIYLKANLSQELRNFKQIDIYNYRPYCRTEKKQYSLFINTRPSIYSVNRNLSKGEKIDIISLPNQASVNDDRGDVFPLIMDLNFLNVLGGNPVFSAMFIGNKRLLNGAYLNYGAQIFYSSNLDFLSLLQTSNINISYFKKKYRLSFGNIRWGRGFSGSYSINRNFKVGAQFGFGNRFYTRPSIIYGGWINTSLKKYISFTTNYSKHYYFDGNNQADLITSNTRFRLPLKQTIGASLNYIRSSSEVPVSLVTNRFGFGLNYGISYLKGKANTNLSYSSNNTPLNIQSAGGYKFAAFAHTSRYRINTDWGVNILNQIQSTEAISQLNPASTVLNNQLVIRGKLWGKSFSPSIFYNILNAQSLQVHSRGVSIGTSYNDLKDSKIISFNIRAGFNKNYANNNSRNQFFMQNSVYARYRVWSGFALYTVGNLGFSSVSFFNSSGVGVPRSIMLSLGKQHQFKNKRFVLNVNSSYRYMSNVNRHTISASPQLYYFSKNGWRFYVLPQLFVSRSGQSQSVSVNEIGDQNRTSTSLNVNFGVRKKLGIRNPWSDIRNPTLSYSAFLDHNGNTVQDFDEENLENIVIRLDDTEVLTNTEGSAKVKYVSADSTYKLSAFALDDTKGFFPKIPSKIKIEKDSTLNIPFVKGVKIYGKIYVDRDKSRIDSDEELDLGSIRITANNGVIVHTLTSYEGSFNMYVPYGDYVISMDETVIGTRFRLLQNNFALTLDNNSESIFIPFNLIEKRKKLNIKRFNSNGQLDQKKQEPLPIPTQETPFEETPEEENIPQETSRVDTANGSAANDNSDTLLKQDGSELFDLLYGKELESFAYPDRTIPRNLAEEAYGDDFENIIGYRVVVGKFKDYLKEDEMNAMISLVRQDSYNIDVEDDHIIINKDFDQKQAAEIFTDSLTQRGYNTIQMIGKYEDVFIDLSK